MANDVDPQIRKTVSLPTSLWRRIEDYQFANRIKRDAEAIRKLVEAGLTTAKNGQIEPSAETEKPPVHSEPDKNVFLRAIADRELAVIQEEDPDERHDLNSAVANTILKIVAATDIFSEDFDKAVGKQLGGADYLQAIMGWNKAMEVWRRRRGDKKGPAPAAPPIP